MAAVWAVLFIIGLWWVATHGKGIVAARLAVWLAAVIIVLVLLGSTIAGNAVSGFVSGLGQAIHGLASFFGDL
jgi:hypothetical protein